MPDILLASPKGLSVYVGLIVNASAYLVRIEVRVKDDDSIRGEEVNADPSCTSCQ